MVMHWDGNETEMPMDCWGRAQAFEGLMKCSRLEYPPFDELTKFVGPAQAALCYCFRLVDTIRFLFALRHGVTTTEEYPSV